MYMCGEKTWKLAVTETSEQFGLDKADGYEVLHSTSHLFLFPLALQITLILAIIFL